MPLVRLLRPQGNVVLVPQLSKALFVMESFLRAYHNNGVISSLLIDIMTTAPQILATGWYTRGYPVHSSWCALSITISKEQNKRSCICNTRVCYSPFLLFRIYNDVPFAPPGGKLTFLKFVTSCKQMDGFIKSKEKTMERSSRCSIMVSTHCSRVACSVNKSPRPARLRRK
jgi:hypothetical protein